MTETRKSPLHFRPAAWSIAAAVALAAAAGVAAAEWAGWPFLARPLERALSQRLGRAVQLTEPGKGSAGFGLRLIGSVRLETPRLLIAAPAWSRAPHLLLARDARFDWAYGDLWRAWQGQALHTRRVQARSLDVQAERRADGEASWSLARPATGAAATPAPTADQLQVEAATVRLDDVPGRLALTAEAAVDGGLRLRARGRYRDVPVQITVSAPSLDASAALSVNASAGRVSLDFDGVASALPRLDRLDGRFTVQGPSLAAMGDPIGVTLPTTGPFRASGRLQRRPGRWDVEVESATVGASTLGGSFAYETDREVPLLSGALRGRRLLLVDLGPVVGVAPVAGTQHSRDKVLPGRPFDLAALRAMDARVDVDIAEVDLDVRRLEPLKPLRARLQLAAGVLVLADLDARTGQGRMTGSLHLDGRGETALWLANLRWDGLRLEHWLRSEGGTRAGRTGAAAAPPYASGRLDGRTSLRGRGLSTADILADLQGGFRSQLHDGAFSHLALEVAGLDLAQSLGVMIRGDAPLPVSCAVADLTVEHGVVRPRALVLDTRDSVVSVDGMVSLASEALDLRVVVMPRDFSPLALRTPLRVHGSFAAPVVSVDKGRLAGKLAASVLLGLVNPLAALIPLLDPGDDTAATRSAAACQDLAARAAKRKATR
jgi:uncharacterized protein involved in outer membrane biogenesis